MLPAFLRHGARLGFHNLEGALLYHGEVRREVGHATEGDAPDPAFHEHDRHNDGVLLARRGQQWTLA